MSDNTVNRVEVAKQIRAAIDRAVDTFGSGAQNTADQTQLLESVVAAVQPHLPKGYEAEAIVHEGGVTIRVKRTGR